MRVRQKCRSLGYPLAPELRGSTYCAHFLSVEQGAQIRYLNGSVDAPGGETCGSDSADWVYVQRISVRG